MEFPTLSPRNNDVETNSLTWRSPCYVVKIFFFLKQVIKQWRKRYLARHSLVSKWGLQPGPLLLLFWSPFKHFTMRKTIFANENSPKQYAIRSYFRLECIYYTLKTRKIHTKISIVSPTSWDYRWFSFSSFSLSAFSTFFDNEYIWLV